ncbi:hypothetical protein SLEP1_g14511 [Rubroshorea leprosula]|uniref:Reverse transcriptase domain-containing protein n=1 Tax=Rubroshorea leprosula TaxID=152421 RepID=A0AAV5IQ83_9ROSI|nr:hypothetical protein SLEP1_g14511 [Rubroshorea leprosula]
MVSEHNQNPNHPKPRASIQLGYDRTPKGTFRSQKGTPEGYGKGEMWKAFIRCGRAINVYVAKKKDKWGQSFGFVRFLAVKNIKDMEIKLNQIKVGQRTIQANMARFSNAEDQIKQKSHSALQHDHKELKDLVEHGKDWLAQWFSDVRPWTPTEVASERFTWLRCQGVPIHIWRSSFFETVAHLFGKFISLDVSAIKKKRLDVAKILILTPVQENIQRVLRVKAGRNIFQIRVNEEIGVDNLFSLRSDFNLISDGGSISEEWLDESNGDFHEHGKWDGNWQVVEKDDEVQPLSGMAELALAESERSMNMSMEEVKISEKIYPHEGSLNAACQNSNSLAADEEPKVNGRKAASDNSLKSVEDKRGGVMKLSREHPNSCSELNPSPGPRQNTFALGQSRLNQLGVKPNHGDKGRYGITSNNEESKMEICDDRKCKLMWGRDNCRWVMKAAHRRSGGGDFNAIRSREEKRGRHFDSIAMRDFNSFIDEAGLEGLRLLGGSFPCFSFVGSALVGLKEKFKMLKNDLKEWNREVFGHIDRKLEKIRCEIKNLDDIVENGGLSESEIEQRRSCFQQFWEWNSRKDSLLFQKSRQKWLQEGDANSKFFHGCIVKRRRRNGIEGVMKNNTWVEEVPKDKSWLTVKFSEEEVKEAVWNCNGSKSLGLDGFNFNFIKRMWPTIKQDIVAFVKEFWENRKLVKGRNSSFIALIPKKESPQGLGDFRPISLIECLYKIISKLLTNRLRKVMPLIISQNQSAFVGKRHIVDGIVIANEVIHEAKKRRRPTLIFKADFEKAYDSVNWNFLNLMMEKFEFCLKWRKWIMECLATSTVSVLVNGSPIAEFSMEKGLRQGDPLAPFLFLLVVEALNGLIHKAKELNMYKGVEVGEERLEVEDISEWAKSLNYVVGAVPFKYLRIPVEANPKKLSTWAPVIDCLRHKLSNWKCESLSFGGRIVLLNAILSSILVYFFSTMRAPKKVSNLLALIQRRFLWGGKEGYRKIAWVSWEKVCRSRKEGGLGVKDLDRFNMALLGKWRWRLVVEKEALWNRVVEAKYGVHKKRDWEGKNVKHNCSYWWKAVWKLDKEVGHNEGWVYKGLVKSVGEGNDTFFWKEGKTTGVGSMIRMDLTQQNLLTPVKYQYRGAGINSIQQVWNPMVPLKVSAFVWKFLQNRIPTGENLLTRGIGGGVLRCEGWKHLQQHTGMIRNGKLKEAWYVSWFLVIWSIWPWRNQLTFKEGKDTPDTVLELIKVRSLHWIKAKTNSELAKEQWWKNPKEALK